MYASFEKIVNRISMLITKINYAAGNCKFFQCHCIIMNVLDHQIVRIGQNGDKSYIMKTCLKYNRKFCIPD